MPRAYPLAIDAGYGHIQGMKNSFRQNLARFAMVAGFAVLAGACAPEIQIRAPKDPIVINLNIKIEQEIRIKVEKDIDALLLNNKDQF